MQMKFFIIIICTVIVQSIWGQDLLSQVHQLEVGGACSMCKDRIEAIAQKIEGVTEVLYDLDRQLLDIQSTPSFIKEKLIVELLKAGHDVDGLKAPDAVYEALPQCCYYRSEDKPSQKQSAIIMTGSSDNNLYIKVSGVCSMCKERIEKVAGNIIGVVETDYDLGQQLLKIEYDKDLFSKQELVNALLYSGHDADGQKAPQDVYLQLHACCHYRDDGHGHNDPAMHTNKIFGNIYEEGSNGIQTPLPGATIFWLGTKIGTTSGIEGGFELELNKKSNILVVSYLGYNPDTLEIKQGGYVNIIISSSSKLLDVVEISHRKKTTTISFLDITKVQQISSKELLKAACCNLAESFDTTPSIDASSTDAITGTRKIEMLGLNGPYIQITKENVPDIRGLASVIGLSLIPGPWIEGIQLNLGSGSVINGFESIAGQINIELKKPCHTSEKMHLNAYYSQAQRFEFNTNTKMDINERWSTATLLHGSTRTLRRDLNGDSFMDMPLGKQFGFVNRWKWTNNNGEEGQIGVRLSYLDNTSGQMDFDPFTSERDKIWGSDFRLNRVDLWAKRGFAKISDLNKSLGFQIKASYHDQKAQYGLRRYDATQKSFYLNVITQNYIGTPDHKTKVGASFQYDGYDEVVGTKNYLRSEIVPGVFGEYSFHRGQKFNFIAGIRADYHNNFGLFFTPRLNVRYAPYEHTVIRASLGRGQRTASIFSENIGIFASNREIIVEENNANTPYGLDAEVSWVKGFSVTRDININNHNLVLTLDAHKIDFTNQIVVDLDQSVRQVYFYNLKGKSYSNSFQFQADYDVTSWFDIRLAYRYNDVRTTYGESLLQKPLISPHRTFVNMALKDKTGWTFDFTLNRMSSLRIPSTEANHPEHHFETSAPGYFIANSQVSKKWKESFEVYLGGENLFDYRQHDAILGAQNPFGPTFDASLVWAPMMGRNIYVGLRYNIF